MHFNLILSFRWINCSFVALYRAIAVQVKLERGKSGQRRAPYHLTNGIHVSEAR